MEDTVNNPSGGIVGVAPPAPERRLALAGTYNVRDLGGYPTPGGMTRWRQLLRADSVYRMSPDGQDQLIREGVRTVIDLRRLSEIEAQPNPLAGHGSIAYHTIPLFDQLAPRADPGEATLAKLYRQTFDDRKAILGDVLTRIADAEEGAVLFHCTAGKDRTGIVAAMLLLICGVDRASVVSDYALSKPFLAPWIAAMEAKAIESKRPSDVRLPMLVCEPGIMETFLSHVEKRIGGLTNIGRHIGLESAALARIRARLVATSCPVE